MKRGTFITWEHVRVVLVVLVAAVILVFGGYKLAKAANLLGKKYSLIAFVPPWLSVRLTSRGQLHWAKRLDPLSVDPYIAQAGRAATPRAEAQALQEAVRKEPRVVELRYDLGLAYARAHELRRARAELLEARRLDPNEPRIQAALRSPPKR